jgi:hypothetical protein
VPRITIRVSDDEHRALSLEAERRGVALSTLVRERLGCEPERAVGAPPGNRNAVGNRSRWRKGRE